MTTPEVKIRISGDESDGVNALNRTAASLDNVSSSARRMGTSVRTGSRRLSAATSQSRAFQNQLQNTAFQVGDFAVQVGAGTSALRAMSMQLPQLLGGFGAMGAVAGGAVAILGALAQHFLMSGDEAGKMAEKLEDVRKNMENLNEEIRRLRLGVSADELIVMDAIVQQTEKVAAAQQLLNENRGRGQQLFEISLAQEKEKLAELEKQLVTLRDQQIEQEQLSSKLAESAAQTRLIYEGMNQTAEQTERTQAYAQLLKEGMTAAQIAALELAGVDITSGISSAAAAAAQLAEQLGISLQRALSIQSMTPLEAQGLGIPGGLGGPMGQHLPQDPNAPFPQQGTVVNADMFKSTGGSRRGGSSSAATGIESLIETLMTEREILDIWYAESLEMLNNANAAELEALGGHHEAMLRLEEEYQNRLKGIRGSSHNDALQNFGSFLGEMEGAFEGSSKAMAKIGKIFGAAEALVNAFRAYNQVLADPSLPWHAKLPAAAAILSAGMKMVSAIQGTSESGTTTGGGGAAGSTPAGVAAAPPTPLEVTLQGISPDDLISGADVFALLDKLQDAAGNRGLRFVGI